MKFGVIFLAYLALASGIVVPRRIDFSVNYADQEFLLKQKFILDVLDQIHQPLQDLTYLQDVETSYVIGSEFYTNYSAIQEFINVYQHGSALPRNYVYSIFEEEHLKETISLFNLFFYSKDWTTFYKNVLWARQNLNERMFLYALSVAVVHRKDMEGIILPSLPEIEPYLFFTGNIMSAANNLQSIDLIKKNFVYSIVANYSDSIEYQNDESKLAYFTEDIGWNEFNYYFHIDYPFWMGGKDFNLLNDRRGELYLYVHQQILARYYMERLSQNLGPISQFSWIKPIKTGYNPHLRYYNGLEFSLRPNFYDITLNGDQDSIDLVQDYERRIRNIIDLGFYNLPTGETIDLRNPISVEFLGNLIQGNPDNSDKKFIDYMTILGRILLGGSNSEANKIQPSVLEHFETAMRDPVFYQLYNRVLKLYSEFKNYLKSYTYQDLLLSGVTIQNVRVTPLITYYDRYPSDITNGVNIVGFNTRNITITPGIKSLKKNLTILDQSQSQAQSQYIILAKQKRLNHKPFIVNIDVISEIQQKVIVRIFLAPKLDSFKNLISLTENRDNFFQIDQFIYDLPIGPSSIKRLSRDFYWSIKDRTTYTELYQKILLGLNGTTPFSIDMSEAHCGFPDRLILPKGWIEGLPLQIYTIISSYDGNQQLLNDFNYKKSCGIGSGTRYLDNLPFGYPFDRSINENAFTVPNMFFKDVFVYHSPQSSFINANMIEGWIPYEFIPLPFRQFKIFN